MTVILISYTPPDFVLDLDIMSATLAPIRSLMKPPRSKSGPSARLGGAKSVGTGKSDREADGNISKGDKGGGSAPVYPVQVACGSTQTGVVMTDGSAYVWGSGFGAQTGVPSLLPVGINRISRRFLVL